MTTSSAPNRSEIQYSRTPRISSNYGRMVPGPSRLLAAALAVLGGISAAAQELPAVIPQTALSPCRAVERASYEDVAPGTAIAVSADGRRIARYFHTIRGAEIQLRDRETAVKSEIHIDPAPLPPGVIWQVRAAAFSPDGALLGVESTGRTLVFSAETGELLYDVSADNGKQLYPAQMQLAGGRLLLALWPPESVLADAKPKKPVEVRLYDASSGKWQHTIFLPLHTSNAWTRLALSPAGDRIAALERATRWPASAQLALFNAEDAKQIWKHKVSAEDVAWTVDAGELIVLGSELAWLDAANGKKLRAGPKKIRGEDQRLRLSDPANAAAGMLQRYSLLKRSVAMSDARGPQFVLWRLDTGDALCSIELDPSQRVDAWVTSRGELVALEETYDVRPPLRIIRAARFVTYKLKPPQAEPPKKKP